MRGLPCPIFVPNDNELLRYELRVVKADVRAGSAYDLSVDGRLKL